MTTQMKAAKEGRVTEEMKTIAMEEDEPPEKIRQRIARGTVIITRNNRREEAHPIGIGEGLRTKVNANVGTSMDLCDINLEIEKARIAVKYGADTVMDLSTAGSIDDVRRRLLEEVNLPV
ncbi:MAG: phosphomethylpyrimidine synthase ThiC, partial [Thermoproteota archaeon]